MIHKIWTQNQISLLQNQFMELAESADYYKTDLLSKVVATVQEYVDTLNYYYGSERNPDTQLGGWVAVILADSLVDVQAEYNQLLDEYSLDSDLAEVREIIAIGKDNMQWIIEIHIVSADYGYIIIFPRKGDNE